ncbi:CPBP family intramembrane glutamic endopeptidase [Evansella tamaricis]|uniref:CPBP family intramembrane metalloprotease n=1 Tax=Evansella tamaricis TaxID=2069301 RepID=A0ABS6JEV0_9BACI|nr:CPBP family intramembrane glutamic endopeptidase [Evansella tamaricis]MBU9712182.1 CPBP family intramembrane metalloprotease [Evansella tamaricis]
MRNIFFITAGFILLTGYFQGMNLFFDGLMWVIFALLFFPLAHYICRFSGLKGLSSLGYYKKGAAKNLIVGFIIGFLCWGIMYLIFYLMGRYEGLNARDFGTIFLLLIQASVGMFLGSTINDAIVRGYFFSHLQGKVSVFVFLSFTSIIYALDDFWYEGFSINNTIFSFLLGLSLAYAFWKTGSIWYTTGLHWGLNMMYSIVYGLPGTGQHGGVFSIKSVNDEDIYFYITIGITVFLLLIVILYFRFTNTNKESGAG